LHRRLQFRVVTILAVLALFQGGGAGAFGGGHGKAARKAEAAGERRIPLAIPDFAVEGDAPAALGKEFPAIVSGDLGLVPLFEPVDRGAWPEAVTAALFREGGPGLDLPRWSQARAEAVLAGRIAAVGDSLRIEIRILDTATGALLFGRRYDSPGTDLRSAAHRVANDIPFAFTGVRGIFDTDIAFSARPVVGNEPGRGKELYIVGIDGENLRQVTNNGSFNLFPRWAPGGRRIAFTSFQTGVPRLYLRDIESRREEALAGSGSSMSPGGFSPSGDILYYSRSESGSTDIFALPVGSDSPARVASGAISTSPTVSPDGTLMAFVSDRNGAPAIFVKELGKGTPERQITAQGKFSTSPCWSPAGDQIAFTSQERGKFSLMLVRPDGSDLRQLLSGGGDYIDPSFSPDGRFIAYAYQEKGRAELRIVSVDGRVTRRVFSGLPGIGSPSWSPRR
jgi:TolB protein